MGPEQEMLVNFRLLGGTRSAAVALGPVGKLGAKWFRVLARSN